MTATFENMIKTVTSLCIESVSDYGLDPSDVPEDLRVRIEDELLDHGPVTDADRVSWRKIVDSEYAEAVERFNQSCSKEY